MASLSCPDCGVKVQPEDLICFRCGANLPHTAAPDEDLPTPTISQRFIAAGSDPSAFCPNCGTGVPDPADVVCSACGQPLPHRRRRISPVVMRITFPTGNVDIPAGTSVLLGRDPAESLVAAAFARFDNVSRRHATVKVDDFGHASIRDENSTNGTFVNEDRVLPGSEVRLVDGDQVRLAADVTGSVSLPQGEPDPSGLSRNGMVLEDDAPRGRHGRS
jgi:ribosomal protein L37E